MIYVDRYGQPISRAQWERYSTDPVYGLIDHMQIARPGNETGTVLTFWTGLMDPDNDQFPFVTISRYCDTPPTLLKTYGRRAEAEAGHREVVDAYLSELGEMLLP